MVRGFWGGWLHVKYLSLFSRAPALDRVSSELQAARQDAAEQLSLKETSLVAAHKTQLDDIVNRYRLQFAKASEEAARQQEQLHAEIEAKVAALETLQAQVGDGLWEGSGAYENLAPLFPSPV